MFSMNMRDEKQPLKRKLLPEGDRIFLIVGAREQISKSGNNMIVFTVKDVQTNSEEEIYAVAEPKKRWFLKTILNAVGCKGSEDGNYNWSFDDVINKKFLGTVEHEDNEYINREGQTIKGKQHRIVETKECAWDE